MPTVVIGSARDIVEHCGVARFVFTDFPLGNPCGHPWRRDMQREVRADEAKQRDLQLWALGKHREVDFFLFFSFLNQLTGQ